MSTATLTTMPPASGPGDDDFELDITLVESGPIIPELLASTSDNCGSTCASACTSCKS
jgi:FxLD family lantipeptide